MLSRLAVGVFLSVVALNPGRAEAQTSETPSTTEGAPAPGTPLAPPPPSTYTSDAAAVDDSVTPEGPAARRGRPRWHDSDLIWENTFTAQTVGIGEEVQTRNPTFESGLVFRPRYYFWETPRESISVRALFDIFREFTNSDTTTDRGELTFSDAELWLSYERELYRRGQLKTELSVLAPYLILPANEASRESGRYVAPGLGLGLRQFVPLSRSLPGPPILGFVRLLAIYNHWFSRATVPTNSELARVRMGPDGASAPADQLRGEALVQHRLRLIGRLGLNGGEDWDFYVEAGFSPTWKYRLDDDVELCGVVATGCARVQTGESGPHYGVITTFAADVSYRFARPLAVSAGYSNVTEQLGADGQRRGFFHSPSARLSLSLVFIPEGLLPPPRSEHAAL